MEISTPQNTVIRNGHIIDPANQRDTKADILIVNGKIEAVGANLVVPDNEVEEFDARGFIVTPGLIDCHVHVYEHATVLGLNPDEHCLSRGVTTVVDAGSAGAGTFTGLRKYVAEKSKCQVLAFVHIAAHGLAAAGCSGGGLGGECDSLNQVDVEKCVECIAANRDMAVGVKIRLSADVQNDGANEQEAYRRALAAASQAQVPLMAHHTFSTVPVEQGHDDSRLSCPGSLRAGDIYTHTFHPYPSTIIDPVSRTIFEDVHKARTKGVLFDVGHGQGSFSWTVAEICAAEKFWPDIISTDLHSGNVKGPAYDLPTVMSKMLHVGMPLYEVIRATTVSPAVAIGRNDKLGSMSPGRTADVSIFVVKDVDIKLEDCQGRLREIKQLLVPVAVWREGTKHPVTQCDSFPKPNDTTTNDPLWEKAIINII